MKGKDLKDVVKIYNDTPEENEKKLKEEDYRIPNWYAVAFLRFFENGHVRKRKRSGCDRV